MLSDIIQGLSRTQRAMVTVIESEFLAAGLPIEIATAAAVNAFAESSLNPKAIDASGTAVGLFQLADNGAGAGLSVTQRQDPVINTRRIIKEVKSKWGAPLLAAYASGVRDVRTLAGLFCRHIERPARVDLTSARREALTAKLFPSLFQAMDPSSAVATAQAPTSLVVSGAFGASGSLADRVVGVSAEKREMVRIIEREFLAAGLPLVVAAAAVVNAFAESGLNPRAVGDGGASVGLFQLHSKGAGSGMSVAERMDPTTNTRRILQVLLGKQGVPVLSAVQSGERGIARLAALFSTHVERPLHKAAEEARRMALAARLFPGIVVEQLPTAVKAGASLVPIFFLAAGLGGTLLALRASR
jgi:hypothetical protein